MFCTKCGNNVPDGTRFCSSCGNDLQPPAQTPNYVQQPIVQPGYPQNQTINGQTAEPTGFNQSGYSQPQYTQQPYNPSAPTPNPYGQVAYTNPNGSAIATKPKPDTKKIVIIAAVIVALIAGAWFIFGGGEDPHESPEAVLNAWVEAYNAHDAGALCNLSADLKRNGNDPEMRRDYIEEFKEEFEYMGNNSKMKVNIISVEYDGNEASVICDVTFMENGKVVETEEREEFPCVKIDGKWYWED